MARLANLQIGAAGYRGAGIDQVSGVKQPGTGLALIATSRLIPAVRTRADDVTIRQKAAVSDRVHLLGLAFLDVPLRFQLTGEVLRKLLVLARRAPSEIIKGQKEAPVDLRLPLMLQTA